MTNIFPITQTTPLKLTDFTKTFENISIVFDKNYDLSSLFDKIELNLIFPFCTFNNYIKVLKDFDIKKQNKWLEVNYKNLSISELLSIAKDKKITIFRNTRKDLLIQKILDYDGKNNKIYDYKKNIINIKHIKQQKYNKPEKKTTIDMYNELNIYNKNNKLYIDLQTDSSNKNFIINNILSLLNLTEQNYSININSFSGKLYLIDNEKDYYLHYGLFSHFLLHTQYYILINEFMNASTTLNSIRLQYIQNKTIKSSLRNNMINKFTKNIDILSSYPSKKIFIEISILECINMNDLSLFIIDLGIIFKLYFDSLQNLIDSYNQIYRKINFKTPFNPDKNKPIVIEYKQSDINNLIDSKMLDSNTTFVSVCPSKRKKPLVIDNNTNLEDLQQIYPFNDYFFKKQETGDRQYMLWPKDDPNNFILYCDDKSNPSIYNYPGITPNNFPCCFKDDQIRTIEKEEHKPNIKSYYYNLEQTAPTSYKKGPKKLLKKDEEGDLISNLLLLVGENTRRIGVEQNEQSFLTCINTKFDVKTDNIENVLIVSKQSNYDKTIEEISEVTKSFIDARYYTTLFEYIYDIYIITFDIDGNIIKPHNKYGYIDYYIPNRNFIFLFENITQNNQKQYEYLTNISNSENFLSLLKYRFNYYHLSKPLLPYTIPPFNILSQYIDDFGKCRIIKFKFNDLEIFAQTFLPPLCINYKNILTDTIIPKISLEIFNQIKSYYNLIIISQYIINNKTSEIYTKFSSSNPTITNDLFFTFNINSEMTYSNIISHPYPKIIQTNTNIYDTFIYHKKSSQSLLQYCLYLYSKNINLSIQNFILNHFLYIQNHKYNIIKTFDNPSFINKDDKLIISYINEIDKNDIVKKLKYYLKLYSIRMMPELIKYKDKITLETLYFSISDFQILPSQNLTSFSKLSSFDKSYEFISSLNIKNNIPFFTFFKDNIVLAFDFLSLSNALYNSQNWFTNKFNYIYSDRYQILDNYTIFDINFKIIKQVGDGTLIILFRKMDNKPIFTSIMLI